MKFLSIDKMVKTLSSKKFYTDWLMLRNKRIIEAYQMICKYCLSNHLSSTHNDYLYSYQYHCRIYLDEFEGHKN